MPPLTRSNNITSRRASAFNIRCNDLHTPASLEGWLRERLDREGARYRLDLTVSGDSFVTKPGAFTELVAGAVRAVTGLSPELSTTGGTSDARFIKNYAKVAEFGLISETMHKVDEHARLADIEALTEVYRRILDGWFEAPC